MDAVDLSIHLTALAALSDSLKHTNSHIAKLANLHFHPQSEPLEADGVVRLELAQDIRESLKQLEQELEFLRQEAEGYQEQTARRRQRVSGAGEEARLSAKVARVGEELAHTRQLFRNAQLAAKIASEKAKREERELLLESYRASAEQIDSPAGEAVDRTRRSAPEALWARRSRHQQQQQKQRSKDEILLNASTDVTAALRRTHDLLSTELSRSRFAQETFDESTAALKNLGEEYSDLDTILTNSRNLLGTLLRSQKSDTWYLETAFYILICTLSWLCFRRILFGPFIKLPLFIWKVFAFVVHWLLLKPLFAVLGAVGVITSEPRTASPSSLVSTTTRAPLIVHPSATGRAAPLPDHLRGQVKAGGIAVGAGGSGAKRGTDRERATEIPRAGREHLPEHDHVLEGKLSEWIGQMAHETATQAEQPQPEELVVRGDGTVLHDRGAEEPIHPLKKNFEADVEDAQHERKQTEDAQHEGKQTEDAQHEGKQTEDAQHEGKQTEDEEAKRDEL